MENENEEGSKKDEFQEFKRSLHDEGEVKAKEDSVAMEGSKKAKKRERGDW